MRPTRRRKVRDFYLVSRRRRVGSIVSVLFMCIRVLAFGIALSTISACSLSDNVALTFDETTVCIPKEYAPGLSIFGLWLERNISGLDSSEGSEIIRIPAEIIKKFVPNYIYSHINEHNVDLKHNINGIAFSMSTVGNSNGMANAAWNVYLSKENPLIKKEEDTGYFRIYPWGEESFSWDLVKYPPPKDGAGSPPDNWYIGFCGSTINTCKQNISYKDIWFSYDIQILDLSVREEIANTLENLFEEWYHNCENER